ncbi:MAG: 50S ribosomal protein L40e [Candidatus Diapherotrites archaeon]|nr:50S ribosomal protein L40e [Candidatus Diapherotrites archaeon]
MAQKHVSDETLMNKKICMNCNARNPPKAKRCRKCSSTKLRMKHKEKSKG